MEDRPKDMSDSAGGHEPDLHELMTGVAKGDHRAFSELYEAIAAPVFGLVQRVVLDVAQSEEVAQEVLVEVWRTATDYRPHRGTVMSWVLTMAHRRAVDRVRAVQASTDREERAGSRSFGTPHDDVSEIVMSRFERRQLQRCIGTLTELQQESVMLTYYQGYTYREAAGLLSTPTATVKTRLRDGLIRLRDCLGVGK